MARTGSSIPTIRPTSRAHSPPALTTCSAWIVSPLSTRTSHVPSGRCSSPTTGRVLVDLRAGHLGALHVGPRDAGRDRRGPRPGRTAPRRSTAGPCSGKMSARLARRDQLQVHPEIPAARLTAIRRKSIRTSVSASISPPRQVDRAVLAGDPLDLLVQLDRVLLEPGDVRVAVERVHAAGRMPRRAGRQLATLEEHDVGPAGLRQVVQDAGPDDAATDDDDLGFVLQRMSPSQ